MKFLICLMQALFCSLLIMLANLEIANATNDKQAKSDNTMVTAIAAGVVEGGMINVVEGKLPPNLSELWPIADAVSLSITGRLTPPPAGDWTKEKVARELASYVVTALPSCQPLIGNPHTYIMCIVFISGSKVVIEVIYWYAKSYLCNNSDDCKQNLDLLQDFAKGMITGGVPEIEMEKALPTILSNSWKTGIGFVATSWMCVEIGRTIVNFKDWWEKTKEQIESWLFT